MPGDFYSAYGDNPDVRIDPTTGRGFIAQPVANEGASLSGPVPRFSSGEPKASKRGMMGSKPHQKNRKMTDEELAKQAQLMIDRQKTMNSQLPSLPVATADALRRSSGPGYPTMSDAYMKYAPVYNRMTMPETLDAYNKYAPVYGNHGQLSPEQAEAVNKVGKESEDKKALEQAYMKYAPAYKGM